MLNTAYTNLLTNIRAQIAPMSDSFEKKIMEYLVNLIDSENVEKNSRPLHLKYICVRLLSILKLFHQQHQSKTLHLEDGLNFTKSMAKSFGARDDAKKDNFHRCSPGVKFSIYSVLLLQIFRQSNSGVYETSWIIDISRMAAGLTEAINPYSLCQLPLLQWMQEAPKNSEAGQLYRHMLTTLDSNLEDDKSTLSTSRVTR